MKHRIIVTFLILILTGPGLHAQKIYKGNSSYTSDIICNIEQESM